MAAGSTYTPIATTTLGSAASSVTFSSISGSYTDLIIISDAILATGADSLSLRFNSDSGNNYSFTYLYGNGTSAVSARITSETRGDFNYIDTARSTGICHIMNYSNTTTYKTYISRWNPVALFTGSYVGLWRNTSAITSIEILKANAGNIAAGSTFTIYGIQAA